MELKTFLVFTVKIKFEVLGCLVQQRFRDNSANSATPKLLIIVQ